MKKKNLKMRKRVLWIGGVIFFVVVIITIVLVWWFLDGSKSDLEKRGIVSRGLPVMEINLNGVDLETINNGSKDKKYEGNELVLYEKGKAKRYDNVEVKGRGNATWGWDKKPYQIEFNRSENMLGMGKSRKWYLLANYKDDTNLRTDIGFLLEEMLDMEYRMRGGFVELYIDGDYNGLYYLTTPVEISKNSVNLKDSLGVLMELDNVYGNNEDHYETKNGDFFTVKDVVNKDKKDEAVVDFLDSYNRLEEAIEEKDYNKIMELANVESFAKYYLLSEFTVNPDAYWTSFYFYKDGVRDIIHMGPGWDFDMALANREWENWLGERLYSTTETMVRKLELSSDVWIEMGYNEEEFELMPLARIMFKLMEIPEFQKEVRQVYYEQMMGRENEFITKIVNKAIRIRQTAEMDMVHWKREDFKMKYEEMLKWIKARYDFFEKEYGYSY